MYSVRLDFDLWIECEIIKCDAKLQKNSDFAHWHARGKGDMLRMTSALVDIFDLTNHYTRVATMVVEFPATFLEYQNCSCGQEEFPEKF